MAYSKEQNRRDIAELQMYLYNISHFAENIPSVIPDGIYGEKTREAVKAFQREYNIAVTGEVDRETWDAIIIVYKHFVKNRPERIDVFPENDYILREGGKEHMICMLQTMLRSIHSAYPNIPSVRLTGKYDEETASAVLKIQELSRLPETGETDKYTWNVIIHLFHHSIQ